MSKHNLSEKSNFTNLSEFLVRKKIIYLVALKYDHTVVFNLPAELGELSDIKTQRTLLVL